MTLRRHPELGRGVRHVRGWMRRLAAVFETGRHEREIRDELEGHLLMHIDDNVRAGMTPEAARRDAMIRLGGVEQVKEHYLDRRGVPALEHLAQDLRFALRVLRRTPSFTVVAVLTLGLGIGVNTAIFSVVNAVLFRPLPFHDSSRLVLIWATNTKNGLTQDVASYPDFEDWQARSRSFDRVAAFTTRGVTISGGDQAEILPALQATPGFFEMLGAAPALGRSFRPEDAGAGAEPVIILSSGWWKQRFAGRANVLGQKVLVNEGPATVIGVMPPDFRFSPVEPEQLYAPLARDPNRNHGFLRVVGRLRPGVRLSAAQAELAAIARQIATEYPKSNANVGVNVVPLVDAMAGTARTGLLMVLGVVSLVLLIACTNVANLMLARNASRERELALRTALGAGRGRLVRQLLTEAVLLSIAGGALGLVLAHWGTELLVALLSNSVPVPRIENSRSDATVLGFTLALSVGTGILFGTVPALVASHIDVHDSLRESSRSASAGVRGRRARTLLMISETALAVVLLGGAGMLLKTLVTLRATAPGFISQNLLTVEFFLPQKKLAGEGARTSFFTNVLTQVRNVSGVRSAALVADLPLGGGSDTLGFRIAERPGEKAVSANFNVVSAAYFRTMGIPVRAGREFTDDDRANTQPVIVINESAARRFWPGENAVGKEIVLPTPRMDASFKVIGTTDVTLTVIGITGDVRQSGLGVAARPEVFLDCLQPGPGWPWLVLVARTDGDPMLIAGAVKTVARDVDRDVPIMRIRALDAVLSGSMAEPRVYTVLLSVFAGLALALAAVGLYGVVSYGVAQRTREMGIRMALGARREDVMRLVLRQGTGYTVAGILIGLGGALAFMHVLATLMPGAQPRDLLTLAEASAVLVLVALAASYIPARRGSRVDPIVAERAE
jgi:putative ABC transport system permease protein